MDSTQQSTRFTGTDGDDTLRGLATDDTLDGLTGRDVLYGGGGADVLIARGGGSLLDGEADDDWLIAHGEASTLIGGAGDDRLSAFGDRSVILGGEGQDALDLRGALRSGFSDVHAQHGLGFGLATSNGAQATRVFAFGVERLALDAGFGAALYDVGLASGEGDVLDRAGAAAHLDFLGAGDDRLRSGDQGSVVFGEAGDDAISGGAGADRVLGGAGADSVSGGGGGDWLDGGAGADLLDGGEGDDTLEIGGLDTAFGGEGNDLFVSAPGSLANPERPAGASLDGGAGFDSALIDVLTLLQVVGGEDGLAANILEGGPYLTLTDIEQVRFAMADGVQTGVALSGDLGGVQVWVTGSADADQITAWDVTGRSGEGGLTVSAGGGDDSVGGSDWSDRLDGGDGADLLIGGLGDDVVLGGAGNDVIYGDGFTG